MSGGAASGRKGSAYERELVNRFDAAGWGALRLPSSGSATDRDLPDVFAGRLAVLPIVGHRRYRDYPDAGPNDFIAENFTEAWAIELKSGKATTLYVDGSEVDDLLAFAETWGAQAYLGARFTTRGSGTKTYLVTPERARGPTDGGRYGLPVADIEERAAVVVSDEGVQRRD